MIQRVGTLLLCGGLLLTTLACHAAATRVDRPDRGVSFQTPTGLRQLEITDAEREAGTLCIIAFARAGKPTPATVGQVEGWRELADYVLEVKQVPLREAARERGLVVDPGSPPQLLPAAPDASVVFTLKHAQIQALPHGELALAETEASKRPASMIRNGTTGQLILVAGNDDRSVAYVHWLSTRSPHSSEDGQALAALFKSMDFTAGN
jgi:hypothetical protein